MVGLIFLSLHSIYNVLKLRSTTIFCFQYSSRTQPPLIRHPCLNSGLFEHRVQTLLKSSRISSTSKFQTYRICSRSHRKTNHPHIQMISELPGNSYCSLLFYCPYYTKVITIKIPKYLAGCFLLLLNWGSFLHFQVFTPTSLLPCPVRLGNFPLFQEFTPTSLLPCPVRLGNFPLFQEFTPTSLLPATAQLGDFSLFPEFTPTSLLPALVPLGNFPYFRNLPQPACFLLLFHWGNFPLFLEFAPTSLLPALVPLGNFPLFLEFAPTSLLQFIYPSVLTLYTYRKSHPAMPCALDRVTSPIYNFI